MSVLKKGDAYGMTFNDFSSANDVKAFVQGGFSVEAFYINRSKSGSQGSFCATDAGGWALAEKNNGAPYFIMMIDGKYVSVDLSTATSEELIHLIGFRSQLQELRVYLNGEFAEARYFRCGNYTLSRKDI